MKVLAGLPASQLPEGARDRLAAAVRDPAHGRAPVVSEDDVVSGRWVSILVEHVEPVAWDLASVVAAQPAGIVSDLDEAIGAALYLPTRLGEGFIPRAGMLERRLPELRLRYGGAAAAQRRAAADVAVREQQRQAQTLRDLGL